jgi:hypothetical protein
VDLRRFEMGIDLRLHHREVAVAAELVEEGPEIGKGRLWHGGWGHGGLG